MGAEPTYAQATFWDGYFTTTADRGEDLNPDGWWAPAFRPYLAYYRVARLLDLGCGTGGDALFLTRHGLQVVGMDHSAVALERARAKARAAGLAVEFRLGDMAQPLPFTDASFHAVMSNVALHSFSDQLTRQVLREVYRVVQPGGLLLLHLNSEADMPYRAQRYRRVEELEPGYYREAHGQTMHFFSEAYCRAVLSEWEVLDLTHVPLQDGDGRVFKCVWRCVARKLVPPDYVAPE
jgi:SAM-dependent methyltransferase